MNNEDLLLKYRYSDPETRLEIEEILINKNRGLVNKILHSKLKYTDDLVQEGMIGLLEAIRKFDTNRGVKFSTFAYNYVRLRTTRFYMDDRLIRIPVWTYYNSLKIDVELKEDYSDCGGIFEMDYTHIEAFNKCLDIIKGKSEQLEYIFIHRMVLGKDLKEVGDELKLSMERVRQLEEKIRECLRSELEKLGYRI